MEGMRFKGTSHGYTSDVRGQVDDLMYCTSIEKRTGS